jgi:cytochrome P450
MVTRTAARDMDLGGHRIPAGADVVWSPYLHQHDPAHFPDADTFDPDRWTPERVQATRGSFLAGERPPLHRDLRGRGAVKSAGRGHRRAPARRAGQIPKAAA